jgi:hypothetical protein
MLPARQFRVKSTTPRQSKSPPLALPLLFDANGFFDANYSVAQKERL